MSLQKSNRDHHHESLRLASQKLTQDDYFNSQLISQRPSTTPATSNGDKIIIIFTAVSNTAISLLTSPNGKEVGNMPSCCEQ